MLGIIKTVNGQKKIIPLTADAGAGNPVGTIIPMYKKSSPSGYLYCDGSTFDETKYPLLYAYLGSNVLPDYREFALVGAEKNTTDIFDSTETDPSTGQAGIQNHDVFSQGEFKNDQVQYHQHFIRRDDNGNFLKKGGLVNTGSTFGTPMFTADQSEADIKATTISKGRSGDVTRGKRKAVFFYIKATSGLSENAQDNVINTLNEERSYSTEEVNTGKKWIDGKPIYRKVVDCGTLPNANYKVVPHNITNIDTVITSNGISTDGTYNLILPYVDAETPTNGVQMYITTISVYLRTGADRSSYTKTKVIIEYTKTTD